MIFCFTWVENPVGISHCCAASYFLLSPFFSFYREYNFLPREFLFCRDLFFFCHELFSYAARFFRLHQLSFFATSFLLLPWAISFLLRAFFFCRRNFSFARSFFLLLWHLLSTVYLNVWCTEYTFWIYILLHIKKHYFIHFSVVFKIVGSLQCILNSSFLPVLQIITAVCRLGHPFYRTTPFMAILLLYLLF